MNLLAFEQQVYWNKNHKAGNRSKRIFQLMILSRILISLQPGQGILHRGLGIGSMAVKGYRGLSLLAIHELLSERYPNLASIGCMYNSTSLANTKWTRQIFSSDKLLFFLSN